MKLSLNLTYFDLMDREFVFDLQMMLAETGVGWSELVIEVQETVVLDEGSGQVFRSLTELRRREAEIALDDYGTGYGTLTHLQTWPVDMVKMRPVLRWGIGTSRRDRAIVASILQLSQELGFRVVAEGSRGRRRRRSCATWGAIWVRAMAWATRWSRRICCGAQHHERTGPDRRSRAGRQGRAQRRKRTTVNPLIRRKKAAQVPAEVAFHPDARDTCQVKVKLVPLVWIGPMARGDTAMCR